MRSNLILCLGLRVTGSRSPNRFSDGVSSAVGDVDGGGEAGSCGVGGAEDVCADPDELKKTIFFEVGVVFTPSALLLPHRRYSIGVEIC